MVGDVKIREKGGGALTFGALLLAAVWLFLPRTTPPLYDGLGLPPEGYRYLHPPPGRAQSNRPPISARQAISVTGGKSLAGAVLTGERPPQAEVTLEDNAVILAAGVSHVLFVLRPVDAPSSPLDGVVDGNVYRLTVTAGRARTPAFRRGTVNIVLRGTGARGKPVIERYTAGHWSRLSTGQYLGSAIYVADITHSGDFALVLPGTSVASGGGTSYLIYALIVVLILGISLISLLLIRLARQRSEPQTR